MDKGWILEEESGQEDLRAIVGLVLFIPLSGVWPAYGSLRWDDRR